MTASSINAYNGRIILSWTNQLTDYITCNGGYKADNNSNYYGIILEGEPFMVQGTGVRAKITGEVTTNFNNATIVPALTATLNAGMEGVSDQTDDLTRGWDYTVPECPFSAPNGKAFLGWQVGDDAANLLAPGYVIQNVSDNLNLTAVWGDTYAVTVDGAVKDYIKVSPTPNLPGATVTITVDQPEYLDLVAGSLQAKVEGDNTGLTLYGGGKTYAFIMPSGNVTVAAQFKLNTEKVPYVDAAGAAQIPVESYKTVSAHDAQWEETSGISGWYVVTQSTTLDARVTVSGDVNLILCDGTTLTADKGIDVAGDNSLTIWAQSLGSAKGALVATGANGCAGIGGGHNSNAYERGGTIVVNGGDITATGGNNAAGIGGSRNSAAGIEINGGEVTATGGMYAAAIGSGGVDSGSDRTAAEENDHISITGGHVEATGGLCAAAIGGGNYVDCGAITIEGGTVVSTAVSNNNGDPCYGAAIGGGKAGGCGNIAISGGSVEVVFSGFSYGAGIGSGCSGSCGDIEITGGVVAATTDNATNNPSRGACIGTGDSGSCTAINIKGGTIRVTANGNGACIGSGATAANDTPTACGAITISGGNVTTISKGNGAGIGSGLYSQCSSITISGGVVNATVEQGGHFGACIGHGQGGVNACQVNITGGMVTAAHGSTGAVESLEKHVAAIGGGWDSGIVTIVISGGTVIAYGNSDLDNSSPRIPQVTSIGRGRDTNHSSNDEVTLSYGDARDTCVYAERFGQNVTLNKSFMNRDVSSQVYNEKIYSSASASEELRGKYLVASDSYGITVEEMQHGTVVPSVLKTVTVRPAMEGNPEETDQVSCDVYRTQPGQTVTLTVAPDAGYKLAPNSLKVTYDGVGSPITPVQVQGDPTKYTFTMPAADATVSASFFKHEFAYTAQGATIAATCSAEPCDLPNRTATLTVKVPAGNLTYDGTEKPATISGDTDAMGTPNISYTKDGVAFAGVPKDAGTYVASITLGEGNGAATASVNYTIKPKSVTITGLTVSSKTYDGTTDATDKVGTGGVTVNGTVGNDNVTAAAGVASFATAGVGTGKVVYFTGWSLSGEKAGNYQLAGQPASVTASITSRDVTITPKPQTIAYGSPLNSDASYVDCNNLAFGHCIGAITLTDSRDAASGIGDYSISIMQGSEVILDESGNNVTANYSINYGSASLTVEKAKAKVTTAPTAEKLTYTGKEQGLVTEGAAENTSMQYALGTDTTTKPAESSWGDSVPTGTNAGDYVVWYRAAGYGENHDASDPVAVAVKINPAPFTVTAKPATITYGDAPANGGVEYSGFVNGETESALGGALGYDYNYAQYGDAGSYAITPKGLTAANYEISYVAGTLTVNPLAVDITWSDAPLTFNGSAQAPTVTAMGLLNGDQVTVALDGAQTNAGGPYTARATGFSGAKAGSYVLSDSAQKTATFSIGKAAAPGLSDVRVTRGYTVSSVSASIADVVPKNAGSVTYAKASDEPIDKVSQWAVSSDGTVTAALANGAIGDTISLPVRVSSTNYEDMTINLVVSLTELWEVVWLNGDGTALDRKLWAEGDAEPVTDKKPVKKATAQYSYTFAGWNEGAWNEAHNVKTYKATFNAATKKYTVKFVGADGKVLQSSSVAYGFTPKYAGKTPKKASTANYRFAFKGWTPAIAKVTKSATYKATFSKIAKKAQTIKAKKSVAANAKANAKTKKLAKKKTVNLKKLAKASAKTKITYKKANKVGGKKIAVNAKTGKVTLKNGLKAGTYRVKVKLTAPANEIYKAAKAKTITLKVTVEA